MNDQDVTNTSTRVENDAIYFANKPAKDLASIVLQRSASFYQVMRSNAFIDKLKNNWRFYYGAYTQDVGYGHRVTFSGEQGELVQVPMNHFRNIAEHMRNMITANRPIMECRAINSDAKSQAQAYLGNGILDYYMREKGLEYAINRAVEMAVILGAGFVKMDWNATAGEAKDADTETGEIIHEGEVEFSNPTVLDVVVDGTKETWANEWMLVRSFMNRYNLMAKYPEFAEKLKNVASKTASDTYRLAIFSNDDTDDIPVYEFFHKKTEATPEGRYALIVNEEIILLDCPMPYQEIPVYRVVPSEILGTPYGYTSMFDVYPIQESINSIIGTLMTNNNAFGVQNLFVPTGSNISMAALGGGLNVIEGTVKPEPLQLTASSPETFKLLEIMTGSAEIISGINSVARGEPQSSLKSGAALALVQSMALQFMSKLQQNYVKLVEDVGTGLIQLLKDFAHQPKVVAIVGRANRSRIKEFTSADIANITRVTVDVGNPLSRTIAGRTQMAEQLLQMKMLKTPEQYFMILNTGRLENAFEGEMQVLLTIREENEMILDGQPVRVNMYDKHGMHLKEHQAIFSDPSVRFNEPLMQLAMGHMQEHIAMLRNLDPQLLMMMGEQPLPPQALPAPDGTPGGQPLPPMQPQQGQPANNQQVMARSPMENMLDASTTLKAGNQDMQGPNGVVDQSLPKIPAPPAPFNNLPTDPTQMIS